MLFLAATLLNAQTIYPNYRDGVIFVRLRENFLEAKPLVLKYKSPNEGQVSTQTYLNNLIRDFSITEIGNPFKGLKSPIFDKTYRISFNEYAKVDALVKRLSLLEEVEFAEKAPYYKVSYTPNDPQRNIQWHNLNINAPDAWDIHKGGNSVIAIVDDGLGVTHPDLVSNLWQNPSEINNGIDDDGNGKVDDLNGWDFVDNDNNPSPATFDSHGTHCAGIASAATDNNIGIASIGFSCKLMGCRAGQGSGLSMTTEGVAYAIQEGANVISMSYGGGSSSSTDQSLFDLAYSRGIVCVAAAGNDDSEDCQYPACYNHVIAVASSDINNEKSGFSNYGSWVDVTAPGSNIYSTYYAAYGNNSGTSMACPLVAGLCGLMKSFEPNLSVDDVERCLYSTCVNINAQNPQYIGKLGHGKIDAGAAMACLNSTPIVRAEFNRAHYTNSLMDFTDRSLVATSWLWSFGDGQTSNVRNTQHTYSSIGEFPITLQINGNLSSQPLSVKILPDVPTPHIGGTSGYSGSFEQNAGTDFAIVNERGSELALGRSNYFGKSGTKTGSVAVVLAPNTEFYSGQTKAYLYTPAYDISEQAYYEFGFWGKYNFLPYADGFTIEYTSDKGRTWRQLGDYSNPNWFPNISSSFSAAFPPGVSFFTNSSIGSSFKEFKRDITEFWGQASHVAFRFVINSTSNQGPSGYTGLAIDDIEVRKYVDLFETRIINFTGQFGLNNSINIEWTTQPMYNCAGFELEYSDNGRDFNLATSTATQFNVPSPGTSLNPQEFNYTHSNRGRDLYYYRIKVKNRDGSYFYSNTIVVKRNMPEDGIFGVFPTLPVGGGNFGVSFNSSVNGKIHYQLFDAAGQLVHSETLTMASELYHEFGVPLNLAAGVYFARFNIEATGKSYTTKITR